MRKIKGKYHVVKELETPTAFEQQKPIVKDNIQTIESKQKNATQEVLDQQPKVMVMIPKMGDSQPPLYVVDINGCKYEIPIGESVKVPQAVAEIMNERLVSEGYLSATASKSRILN